MAVLDRSARSLPRSARYPAVYVADYNGIVHRASVRVGQLPADGTFRSFSVPLVTALMQNGCVARARAVASFSRQTPA